MSGSDHAFEMEITEEMIEFFSKSEEHRKQRGMKHSQIQDFFQGGSRPGGQKIDWTMLLLFFLNPQLILQFTEGVQWFYYQ